MSDHKELLKQTALYQKHVDLGAKMVPFAGYAMPVNYPLGILKEHLHTREKAGLFDVSHMGQAFLIAEDGTYETAARALEALVPADIMGMAPGQQRYSQLLADDGGILDDLMISRMAMPGHEHWLYLVVNAGCKADDYAHIDAYLPNGVSLTVRDNLLSLIALQGPKAAEVLGALNPVVKDLIFMTHTDVQLDGIWAHVSRSGYTGEDGYEISVKHDDVAALVDKLLAHADVEMIGLGARDSLRLEAGLCLYGHDIDTSTSPIEAGLIWSIPKARRVSGGFAGAARVQSEIANKPSRRLVGIKPEGRAPAREGAEIQNTDGETIGVVTSGGFGPSVGGPVAMGYVKAAYAKSGTELSLSVRGRALPASVMKLPFVAHTYYRGEG